ncbi:MAG: dihydroneopterin aldolase [Candidatus Marinimicrobia bacterium]|nr:dihydroneopterin aldolase [Candidatus Neomarinimicrobiota bacterium]|tara:strand:- start:4679 stop:5038 length:360 start_codon:yes stop_codon:yes gene_type:complete
MHKIKISNLEIFGFHGVYHHEKEKGQYFYLDIDYSLKKNIDLINDSIDNTVDYIEFISTIIDLFNKKRYSLIEVLAKDIVQKIVSIYDVGYIKLVIRKKIILDNNNIDFISVEVEKKSE